MKKLTPDKDKHFQRISNNEVYEGTIYVPDTINAEDFRQITDAEYQKIVKEGDEVTQQEYDELIDRIINVENKNIENSEQITETQIALCELYEQMIV